MDRWYTWLLSGALLVLAAGVLFALIRAIRGPRIADRIVGVNLIGSMSSGMIAVLAVLLKQSWLVDVSLVYCMISCLAVVVLAKIRIAAHREGGDDDE